MDWKTIKQRNKMSNLQIRYHFGFLFDFLHLKMCKSIKRWKSKTDMSIWVPNACNYKEKLKERFVMLGFEHKIFSKNFITF